MYSFYSCEGLDSKKTLPIKIIFIHNTGLKIEEEEKGLLMFEGSRWLLSESHEPHCAPAAS